MRQFISQTLTAFTRLLYQRTILILTLLFIFGLAIALSNMWRLSFSLIKSQALQNSMLYAQAIREARTLYSDGAIDRIKADNINAAHKIIITDDYHSKKRAIPGDIHIV